MSTLTLPADAIIIAYDPKDGLGTLRTSEGVELRFGTSACTDFVPEEGLNVWLVETKPDPLGRGERAKVVNRSGNVEKDRVAQIWDRYDALDAEHGREVALLESLGLPGEETGPSDYALLSPENRVRLAEGVMDLRRSSRLFVEGFTALTELAPTLLHPYLDELSYQDGHESLAWTDAPVSALPPLMATLRTDWQPGKHVVLEDPVAAAALALARSGCDEALRALEAWLGALEEGVRRQALTWLRLADVVQLGSRTLARHFTRTCLEVLPADLDDEDGALPEAPVAQGTLWQPIPEVSCKKCGSALVDALQFDGDGTAYGVPWPARLPTCVTCITHGGTVNVVLSQDGTPSSMGSDRASKRRKRLEPPEPRPVDFVPGRTWRSIMMSDGERLHRLGGAPSWVHYPEAHPCPRCKEPMHAVGQVRDDESLFSDTGMLYGVACEACRIISTFAQS
jgi:hypothetical protein